MQSARTSLRSRPRNAWSQNPHRTHWRPDLFRRFPQAVAARLKREHQYCSWVRSAYPMCFPKWQRWHRVCSRISFITCRPAIPRPPSVSIVILRSSRQTSLGKTALTHLWCMTLGMSSKTRERPPVVAAMQSLACRPSRRSGGWDVRLERGTLCVDSGSDMSNLQKVP